MNNNAWFKKEMPLQTVIGFGGGATGFGAHSSVASKPYVDDVFSTYVYTGNESARSINNGINLSSKNGLVWVKSRNDTHDHHLVDTVRGANKILYSNTSGGQTNTANRITGFNSDGFTLGTAGQVNGTSAYDYSSWTFREQKGFFDIVTWTGDGGGQRNISHNLGSNIGSIMARRYDGSSTWNVWHSSFNSRYGINNSSAIYLQSTEAINQGADPWGYPSPSFTSTSFSVDSRLNDNGHEYIAYVFAGGFGSSDIAVDFDGASDSDALTVADFPNFRTENFTVECWIYPHVASGAGINTIMDNYQNSSSTGAWWALHQNDDGFYWGRNNANPISTSGNLTANTWYHVAMVRNGSSFVLYLNGSSIGSYTESYDYTDGGSETRTLSVGRQHNPGSGRQFDGLISNARITIGQALYTTSFNVPHDPLTQTTQNAQSSNVKLLCCNGSNATSSTVTPGTITAIGSPSVSTSESIFDDRSAYVFGENEDKGVVKTGLYYGNGSSTGPEINLGWEPQWILIRNLNDAESWPLYDSMRGISNGGDDMGLYPNDTYAEYSADLMELTSTGFKIVSSAADINDSGDKFMYWAIRRPDGYVGKSPELGTGVFAMDTGSGGGSGTMPTFDSTFPVDFALHRPTTTANWDVLGRLVQGKYLQTNNTNNEGSWGDATFDSNVGFMKTGDGSTYQAWMWKRGQGMDVVVYKGYDPGGVREIQHSLNQVPEMIWVKPRDYSNVGPWTVYHKGLNGGTNPEQYSIRLNETSAEADTTGSWGDTAPTSTHFTVGDSNDGNGTYDYVAYLFASANDADDNPISKVGYYSGQATELTITTGFAPRFLIIRRINGADNWWVFDTMRGWASGNNSKLLQLDTNSSESTQDFGEPISTGFTLVGDSTRINAAGNDYIYYAHA